KSAAAKRIARSRPTVGAKWQGPRKAYRRASVCKREELARRRTASTKYGPVAAGEADEQEAPQLRGGTFAEIHGCHRRFARMRSSALFCEPASAARRRRRAHVARDRDPRPQSAMARRRGHHACGGA